MGNGHDSDEEAEALLLRYRVASALVDGERMADRWDVTAGATR